MAVGYQELVRQREVVVAQIRQHQTVMVRSFIAINKQCLKPSIAKIYEKMETEMSKPIRNNSLIDEYIDLIMDELEG